MKILITGCAGFIGSSIGRRCLSDGHSVKGIDKITDNYSADLKEKNLADLKRSDSFSFLKEDILETDIAQLLSGVDVVFHEAAIPGVRDSWGGQFEVYVNNNILATQMLLEGCKDIGLTKFVYASSSSLYGDAESFPTSEKALPRPMSPYGVSKLSAEHLCMLYERNFGVPAVALRYFTVYGPRQRPDMAFHKMFRAACTGGEFPLFGDGAQTRDFTFIDDAVQANIAAMEQGVPGRAYNIGGGSRVSMLDVFAMSEKIAGTPMPIKKTGEMKGDVRHTSADVSLAEKEIGYRPVVGLEEGLTREWEWIKELYS